MSNILKRIFKRNTHNLILKGLSGFGRSMNRMYENRNHDPYSNGESTVLKKLNTLSPATIIDGGSNIGDYSVLATRFCPDSKLFAFEPVVSTFNLLKKNVLAYKNITPVNAGLYSGNIQKEIKIYNSHTHSSIYEIKGVDYSVQKTEIIELMKGDLYMEQNSIYKIDFLKLDIEGAELDALKGFEKALTNRTIRMIQFEYGYINITSKNLLVDYYDYLNKFNFIIGKIYPKNVEFRNYKFKHEDFIGPNYIAIHESDNVLKNLLKNR